ncbi:molybdenum cofactor guanylyltransferase [Georgenia muralis]|uniref:Molybdopterin-guanine dinucleotide biosynthesis protein A n=1 Tax=Georgenia muralis TaxID=154117 RepID=A0A3N5A166_9MICO|nr:NTP transferase domain-containing protein [Georgenia muralis]RPF27095.1 molybdopterin-guanine dinucleotide biosynthesis protein A [Georgenia muralis]
MTRDARTSPAGDDAAGHHTAGTTEPFDAVVLAGGTGRRLGGASKPGVELAGRRLLDHVLDAVAGARRVVVVAPDDVAVPPGVVRTLEDPPLGGPAAGLAAGLAALTDGAAPWTAVLACDAPRAGTALGRLRAAAAAVPTDAPGRPGPDGACLVDAAGSVQWLTGMYRTASLRAAVAGPAGARGRSVRSLLGDLDIVLVGAVGEEAADVDTWADLDRLEGRTGTGRAEPPPGTRT